MAKELGCDMVFTPSPPLKDKPHAADPKLVADIIEATEGGVDVAFEMVGHNSALNNAIKMVRRGGHVIMFGVRNGDVILEDYHRVVMNGLTLHGVVGRRIFDTWETTRALLENHSNQIQKKIYEIILAEGKGTIIHIDDWEKESFEKVIQRYPKPIIKFS
jgi:threonine 3-dehydrogenase